MKTQKEIFIERMNLIYSQVYNLLKLQPLNSGNIISTDGSNLIWSAGGGTSLPDQSGHSGEFLTTNGTTASWGAISGGGDALTSNPLSQFAATTSLQLKGVISDETGSGALVFADTPTLVTPILGVATATSINKITVTAPATGATLTIDDGFTLHATGNVTALSGSHTGTSSGTNTGDQTSIVGISGTKAQFDTACSDGNFYFVGDSLPSQVAGSNTQIQFNNSGAFGASANLTWNGSTLALNASAETATIAVKGAGATSTTKSLVIEDSAAANMFVLNDAGQFEVGKDFSNASNSAYYTFNVGSISAGNIIYTNTSGGTITAGVGFMSGEIRYAGSQAYSAGKGLDFNILNDNTSTSNAFTAINASARNNATTSRGASLTGIKASAYLDNQNGGTVTDLIALNTINLGINASGPTVTNVYGLKINDIFNSGTITNTYGIYIGDLTTGAQTNTAFSVYASDSSAISYLAGKTGFGTATAPSTTIHAVTSTSNTSTVQNVLTLGANSTGTAAAGFGTGILFQAESSTTDNRDLGRFQAYWTTATDGSREGAFSWALDDNGSGTLTEVMKLDRTTSTGKLSIGTSNPVTIGTVTFTLGTSYTIGNSSNVLTLNSSSTSGGLTLTSSGIHTGGSAGITVGTTGFTSSTLNKTVMRFTDTYTPTTGSGTLTFLELAGTINQSSGGTGITRGIYLNTTLTSPADYRSLESANGKIKFTDTQSAGSGSLAGSLLDLAQTWNTSGTPTAVKLNVTDTSSNAASLLMDLQVGGSTIFSVNKSGFTRFGGTSSSFPALKRSTTFLQARLADDSAFAGVKVAECQIDGTNSTNADDQTINKAAGSFYVDTGTLSVTITNSFVTENSLVFVELLQEDSTARIKNVVPANGSFTMKMLVAATDAEVRVGFLVVNL